MPATCACSPMPDSMWSTTRAWSIRSSASKSTTSTETAPAAISGSTSPATSDPGRVARTIVRPAARRRATARPISLRPPKTATTSREDVAADDEEAGVDMRPILPRPRRRPGSARCAMLVDMNRTLADLSAEAHEFLAEYHLGTLSSIRRDGSPHLVAVGFTVDVEAGLARVITRRGSQKARNAQRGGRAAVANVGDRGRWLTFEGRVHLLTDEAAVREGERRYALRYREPTPNPERVVVAIEVDRVLGSARMFSGL